MKTTVFEMLTKADNCKINGIEVTQPNFVLDSKIGELVKLRERNTNKGNYGHALLMAGSYGKMGAAMSSLP